MFELNPLTKSRALNLKRRRAAALTVAVVMTFYLSLILPVKASAAEQLTITVSNTGMTPTSATVSGGIVHLKIENSSMRDSITLRISREGGSLVREIVLPEGTRELSTELEIGAGQYVVTETSNTAWTCALTVQ